MTAIACTEDQFLTDIADHEMTVLRDDGCHRHIRFRRKESRSYWFDLVTWPGALCIDGDMGTYVFRRLEDMFEFFRADREYLTRHGIKLAINPGYWSEKLVAPSSRAAEEFSADAFRRRVKEAFDAYVAEGTIDDDPKAGDRLWSELESEVLSVADDGEIRAYDAARAFRSEGGEDFSLEDCWEWNCREYTFHFLWCCYAVAWGVKTYDEAKSAILAIDAALEQTQ